VSPTRAKLDDARKKALSAVLTLFVGPMEQQIARRQRCGQITEHDARCRLMRLRELVDTVKRTMGAMLELGQRDTMFRERPYPFPTTPGGEGEST